jgi:hypothetical protein
VDTTGKGAAAVMPYMNLGDKPAPKDAAK